MSPAWIRPRVVKVSSRNPRGRTYQVLYRRGGRLHRIESAGTFKTQTDARTRRDLVGGWLAAGLNPKDELRKLTAIETVEAKSALRWRDEWLTSRHDLAPKSERLYRNGTDAILAILDPADLFTVTVADCQLAAGELVAMKSTRGRPFAASTIANYWQAFAQLLDHIGLDPNPARDKRIKLPKVKQKPPTVPTAEHTTVILERIADKYKLPTVFIEQTAVRVETIETATWGVVDVAGCRVRIDEKGGKIRWASVPAWLMRQFEETCPLEDRLPARRLFPGITTQGLRGAMAQACRLGKIPHYHPHDLRHRRASLWHLQGIPDAVLAERVGHERASFTKDVYVHVMPVEEIPGERLEAIVAEARR
jgi:integrase